MTVVRASEPPLLADVSVAPLRERQIRDAVHAVGVAEASAGARAIESGGEIPIADARRPDRVDAGDRAAAADPSPRGQRRERGPQTVPGHPDRPSAQRSQMAIERLPDRVERGQETTMDA